MRFQTKKHASKAQNSAYFAGFVRQINVLRRSDPNQAGPKNCLGFNLLGIDTIHLDQHTFVYTPHGLRNYELPDHHTFDKDIL